MSTYNRKLRIFFFQYSNGNKTDENQQSSTSSGSQQPPRKAKCKKKEDSETSAATAGSAGGSTKNEDLKPPDDTIETLEEFYDKVEVKVKIPDKLKPYLVDDWDYLTRQVSFISVSIFKLALSLPEERSF